MDQPRPDAPDLLHEERRAVELGAFGAHRVDTKRCQRVEDRRVRFGAGDDMKPHTGVARYGTQACKVVLERAALAQIPQHPVQDRGGIRPKGG